MGMRIENGGIPIAIFAFGAVMLFASIYLLQNLSLIVGFGNAAIALANAYKVNLTSNATISAVVLNLPAYVLSVRLAFFLITLSLIVFSVGALNIFARIINRESLLITASASFVYLILFYMFELHTTFQYLTIAIYASTALSFALSLYLLFAKRNKPKLHEAKSSIFINPKTPYTNLINLEEGLLSKLHGRLRILDMHFDSAAMENLSILLDGNEKNFTDIEILASDARINSKLKKYYREYASELKNKGVNLSMRIMNDEDASQQHERLLIDDSTAYKIPPFNIINKKSEHIVRVSSAEARKRYEYLWQRASKIENIEGQQQAPNA